MTKPQHLCLLALASSAGGLTTLPSSALLREPIRRYPSSTALQYQADAFVDVEILSHQKLDLIRVTSNATSDMDGAYNESSSKVMGRQREIRIPKEWYPERLTPELNSDPSSCSAYRPKESKTPDSTIMVRIIQWKKQTGDIVKQGDTMLILQKSQIDSYGRTVDKQRIEVACKDDGILKSILIRKDEELNLNKHKTRSLLAILDPIKFHSIKIDKRSRMDTALLHDETEAKKKEFMNTIKEKEDQVSNVTSGGVSNNATNDSLLDVDGKCSQNVTASTNKNDILKDVNDFLGDIYGNFFEKGATANEQESQVDFKEVNCGEEILPEAKVSLESEHYMFEEEECGERSEVRLSKQPTTVINRTIFNDLHEAGRNATTSEPKACAARPSKDAEPSCGQPKTEEELLPCMSNATNPVGNQTSKQTVEATAKFRKETATEKVMLEDHDNLTATRDVVSSIEKTLVETEMDVDWIVDTSTKVVADIMFGELPQDTNAKASDNEKGSHCDEESFDALSKSTKQEREDVGSRKVEIYDVVMDFFTETFKREN